MKENEGMKNVASSLQLAEMPVDPDAARQAISERVNWMITHDFSGLVQLLYRMDINENRLRKILEENTEQDAGELVAGLMIEREEQKIRSRNEFRSNDTISDEEKW